MTCLKCTSLTLERWEHELREWEVFCPLCSWRPAYAERKPSPPKSPRVRYEREATAHLCKCGRAKVPWRSSCRDCLDRWIEFDWKYTKREKTRAVKATRKAFGA